MTVPAHVARPPRRLRRRRLAELVLGVALGAGAVSAAPHVGSYAADRLVPQRATADPLGERQGMAPGAGEAVGLPATPAPVPVRLPAPAAPTWVWDRPPAAVAPLRPAGGVAPVITRVETTDPVVFLTIDDGTVRSPEALAAFRAMRIPASLFLNDGPIAEGGDWFAQMPRTVVQGHTSTHPLMTRLGEEDQRRQICANAERIERRFGQRPVLFRPPFGAYDDATQRAAASCGMRGVVLWQQDVRGDTISFREGAQIRRGDIVLMHFRPTFVQELTVIRDRVVDAGLHFALLEDYVAPDASPDRSPG